MAISVVQTVKAANHTANTQRTATLASTSSGNLLVAIFCGTLDASVDPTPPSGWVKRLGGIGPSTFGIWLYEYVNNPGSITGVTFTHGASVSAVSQLYLLEASGIDTSSPIDQTGTVNQGASALTKTNTASGANSTADSLIVSGYMQQSASALTFTDTTTGYTQAQTDTLGETGALSWKIASSTETSADTGTSTLSRVWNMALATYKPASGGTTTQTTTGVSRVLTTTIQTITGVTRVQVTTSQNVVGKSNIQGITTRTITGLSKIVSVSTQTITGKAKISARNLRTITGKANITVGSPAQHHMTGRIMDYDQGNIGVILGAIEGTMIPITTTTVAPTNPPTGGSGLVVQVVSGVITLWIWDGAAWRSKS